MKKPSRSIDDYIARFPRETQEILQKIRALVHECAPEATETIAYGIPTFRLHGNLLHFGAYEKHIGFYPTPSVIAALVTDLQPYGPAKGSVRFLLNRPIPYELIERKVCFRLEEQGGAK